MKATVKPHCDGKTKHKTELSADYYLDHKSSNVSDTKYRCKSCGFWHIGHLGEKIPKRAIEDFGKRKPAKIRKFKKNRSRE